MKRQFTVTSPAFVGKLIFAYSEVGVLAGFTNEAELEGEQVDWLAANFPTNMAWLEKMKAGSKTLTIIDSTVPPDFKDFWDQYAFKINKIDCEKLWGKLAIEDKYKVLHAIPAYRFYLMQHPNQERQYPDTYLKKRTFDNDFAALIKK